ncbi:MAG TPA: hypothetical protein P5136_00585 [Methanofastidiosum sp.]|nr:hypothetical protein [Methanofastidiosum sp.]
MENEFKGFFEENRDVIKNLAIPEDEFEKVLTLLSPKNSRARTTSDLKREILNLNLSNPDEVLLTINITSNLKAFQANLETAIFSEQVQIEDLTATSILDVHKCLYKIFYFLGSSAKGSDISLSTFLIALNLLSFSKICDRTELIKFAVNICKSNNYSLQDIIDGVFKSFYFYSYFEVEKAVNKMFGSESESKLN